MQEVGDTRLGDAQRRYFFIGRPGAADDASSPAGLEIKSMRQNFRTEPTATLTALYLSVSPSAASPVSLNHV
jgi:hypothetical protein